MCVGGKSERGQQLALFLSWPDGLGLALLPPQVDVPSLDHPSPVQALTTKWGL